ncbi:hypothetical protein BUALT_Bualt08G0100400 [Buddleja alternifolia]|uniref:Uncharacterized protein n=1 Tax=Buddleja alternifolia TaxID=168488 RepID=A0AAV6XCA0_9LAMI|nr:hypothetical protein BUALT_Bualt08G0100400 [Buddleja alternifolia]
MLLAVEGGGFFSSSASGYSKGLTLLLLGQKNEEQPMRVTPCIQYQLVDQEAEPDLQLASEKNRLVRGCASFVCFGRAAAGPENPSPLKVGPTQNREVLSGPQKQDILPGPQKQEVLPVPQKHDVLPEPLVFYESKDHTHSVDPVVDDDSNKKRVSLKSSLKRPTKSAPVAVAVDSGGGNNNEHKALREKANDVACQMERRNVQWTDTIGGELFEIREFEMSEDESDDEFDQGNEKTCSCRIM